MAVACKLFIAKPLYQPMLFYLQHLAEPYVVNYLKEKVNEFVICIVDSIWLRLRKEGMWAYM